MDKTDILEKSRTEGQDEGVERTVDQSRKIGQRAFLGMYLLVMLFDVFFSRISYEVMALFWAYLAALSWPMYRFTKNKIHFAITVIGALASLGYLVCHIRNVVM